MTANKEILYWRSDESWYEYDEDKKEYTLTSLAPERAIKSFELMKDYEKEGRL